MADRTEKSIRRARYYAAEGKSLMLQHSKDVYQTYSINDQNPARLIGSLTDPMTVLNYISDSGYIDEGLRKEKLNPLMNKWLPPRGTSPSDADVVFSVAYGPSKMLLDAFEKGEKMKMGLCPVHLEDGVEENSKTKDENEEDVRSSVEKKRTNVAIPLDPSKGAVSVQPITSTNLDHTVNPSIIRRRIPADQATKATTKSNVIMDKDVESIEWTMVEHSSDEDLGEDDWFMAEQNLDEKKKPRKLYAVSAFR